MKLPSRERVLPALRWAVGAAYVIGVGAYWLWARTQGPGTGPFIDVLVYIMILSGGRAVFGAADIGASIEAVQSLRDTVGELRGLLQDAKELADQEDDDQ